MKDQGHLPEALDLCARYGMLPEGATVLCALSGGADSVCLLHWLYTQREPRRLRLIAAHYNHQLRGLGLTGTSSSSARLLPPCPVWRW